MTIDTRELERMLVEIVTGKTPTLRTPEADAMRSKLTAEVKEIQAKGLAVEIPFEIPDIDPPEVPSNNGTSMKNESEKPTSLEQIDAEEDFPPRSEEFHAECEDFAKKFFEKHGKDLSGLTQKKPDAPK